jgi:hypothetical protein
MMPLTTFKGLRRFYRRTKMSRRRFREQLLNSFESTLRYYPTFDPHGLRREMPQVDYVKLVDMESEQEDEGRE